MVELNEQRGSNIFNLNFEKFGGKLELCIQNHMDSSWSNQEIRRFESVQSVKYLDLSPFNVEIHWFEFMEFRNI